VAVIAMASMALAPLGARVAHATDTRKLKRVFAVLLYGLSAHMFWRGLTA
jgi:uncharacterized protein